MSAPRACSCGRTVASGLRCVCVVERLREHDRRRGGARKRGYNSQWERESKAFLALPQNRLCCCGCGHPATTVDHRIPHKGNMALFWDRSNWQPMAGRCHRRKSASHDGAFGNPVRPYGGGENREPGRASRAGESRMVAVKSVLGF